MNWLANLFVFTEATWLFVIGFFVLFFLGSLVGSYIHLRRCDHGQSPDPQLALKVLLHFCFSLCVFVMLMGLTVVVRSLIEEYSPNRRAEPPSSESGWYLTLAGAALAGMYFSSLYYGTNHRLFGAAGRVYTFWRFAIHNFVVITAAVLLAVTMSEPAPGNRPRYLEYMTRQWVLLATILVWGVSWLLHLWLVMRHLSGHATVSRSMSWEVQEPAVKS
jgi:hypothetical protein